MLSILSAWRGLSRHSLYSLWRHYIRLRHMDPLFPDQAGPCSVLIASPGTQGLTTPAA